MKIRNGFVSNSSSSSFIIYGNEVNCKADLEELLGDVKSEINHKAKNYYSYDKSHSRNAFDYLLNKFKDVKNNVKITDDEQYWDLADRKVYEVDVDIFLKQLDNRESWIYKVLEENVYRSLDYAPIDYHHATFAVKDNDNYKCRFDMLNAEEKETVGKALTDRAVVEIKDDIKRLGDDPKVYFITFCTDDGEGEGFDGFFRDGEVFTNANVIRDERS